MKGFFITATDTGVGKTVITAAVVKVIASLGLKTGAMKPVESGCIKRGGRLVPQDGAFLKRLSGMKEPLQSITPVCLEKPLAPFLAAEMEKKEIDIARVRKAMQMLSERYDALVIEGVGGIMVPLRRDYFVADLAAESGLPLIVVSRPSLGTINHTILTVDYALRRGLEVAGVVINYNCPPSGDLAEKTNPTLLTRLLPVPILGTFPYVEDLNAETIEREALKNLNVEKIEKCLKTG
jgi:dethiobiotin synthetase